MIIFSTKVAFRGLKFIGGTQKIMDGITKSINSLYFSIFNRFQRKRSNNLRIVTHTLKQILIFHIDCK